MDCPSTDRLVDHFETGPAGADLELQAHLQRCAGCRLELRILRAIRVAPAGSFVSAEVNERVILKILAFD